jgi:hypothetical protein
MTDAGRMYVLKYDDGATESVRAETASEAVRNRARELLPHTMTDVTAITEWARGLREDRPTVERQPAEWER